jgi:NTP pyrophosphatase (non-canonical NTP hydrolase)
MHLNDYQKLAELTAEYPHRGSLDGLTYTVLGLSGESGELANKLKKILRGDKTLAGEYAYEIAQELGDVLWYVSELAHNLGYDLEDIADMNLKKLKSRKERNVIKGAGDTR